MKRAAHRAAWLIMLCAAIVFIVSTFDDAWGSEAPYLVRIEKDTVAYAPDGSRSDIKAGSEIDVCVTDEPIQEDPPEVPPRVKAGWNYDMSGMTFIVTDPCPERPLFGDGFE